MNDTHPIPDTPDAGGGTLPYRAAIDDQTDRFERLMDATARVGGDVILLAAVAVGAITLLRAVILLIV